MKNEKKYCGKTVSEIREFYFKGKLKKLLNDIQATGEYADNEILELGSFLDTLKKSDAKFLNTVQENFVIDDGEIKPPTVNDLIDGMDDSEWRKKADETQTFIEKTLTSMRQGIRDKKTFRQGFWLDLATIINSVQEVLDKDRIYQDQKYRAKMTALMDDFGISRAEAEERAKLTNEYAKYKNAVLQKERLDELINLCKKHDAKE